MSEYHNNEAFTARMDRRRSSPEPIATLGAFWSVTCMNNWRKVVHEQLCLLAHVGIHEVTCSVLGSAADAAWLVAVAWRFGIAVTVGFRSEDLGLYEGPALGLVHAWAKDNYHAAVLYFHTKGVSAPNDSHKQRWRRLMQKEVVAEWRRNLDLLKVADMVGVSWQELPDFPHFCGNFWMARCDWVAHLQHPNEYRKRNPHLMWGSHSWPNRMYVETWIGSEPWHHVESFCCRTSGIWCHDDRQLYQFPIEVEGLSYDAIDRTDLPMPPRTIRIFDEPFRHWVVDGAVDEQWLRDVAREVPTPDWPCWHRYQNDLERKRTCQTPYRLGPQTARLLWYFNSREWVAWLQKITDVSPLFPDNTLHGGGLHVMDNGGALGTHIDYALHPILNLERRLNLILFFNEQWDERWGGSLLLKDDMGERTVTKVAPTWNRAVLWEPSDISYHGTEEIECPAGMERRSLAVYYLSAPRPSAVRKRALFIPDRRPA